MSQRNPYRVLGVGSGATNDEIKSAYKRLARRHHPDRNPGDTRAEERFKEISAAFEILSDGDKRRLYDEFGEEATRMGFDVERARAYRRWQGAGDGIGGFDLGDLFGDMLGGRWAGSGFAQAPLAGDDIEAKMTVTFEEAALGGERHIALERAGSTLSLAVKIPAGLEAGQRIRLAGRGLPGINGGPPGDLRISVAINGHRLFTRRRRDLHIDVPVTVREAMFGARIDVPTLESRVSLKVPAKSNNGKILRLRGKGLPASRDHGAGDLYVMLSITVPRNNSRAARQAAETLEGLYDGDVRSSLR